mgnify:CR=1 FL=1
MHSVHPTPKFSIITVTYNAEKVLEDTIQSVISQTYHHVEYIIVDGASKDGTLSIIETRRGASWRLPPIHAAGGCVFGTSRQLSKFTISKTSRLSHRGRLGFGRGRMRRLSCIAVGRVWSPN